MTIEEFIAELKKHEIKFEYIIFDGVNCGFRTKDGFCPICALIHAKGANVDYRDNSSAGTLGIFYLGLNAMDTATIISAADNMYPGENASTIKKELEKLCYAQS